MSVVNENLSFLNVPDAVRLNLLALKAYAERLASEESSGGSFTNPTITGGTMDNTVIGGTTPAAVTGTTVTANTGFVGPLTGNVTGNITGNVTGAVTGNVTGNLTGNVTGNTAGTQTGNHTATKSDLALTGSIQGDAALVVNDFTNLTGADGTKGAILPAISTGKLFIITNSDNSGVAKLYPPTGGKLNRGSANASLSIPANTDCIVVGDMEAATDYTVYMITQDVLQSFGTTLSLGVAGTIAWIINSSYALVPNIDATYDIGNLASNPRDIISSRSRILKGIASSSGYGQQSVTFMSAQGTASAATTFSIAVNVPSGCVLVGTSLRVDTALTSSDGGTTFSAAYATGATQSIGTGIAFAKNTKKDAFFNPNAASPITSGTTTITVTCDGGKTFSAGGQVTAVCYYRALTSLIDAP